MALKILLVDDEPNITKVVASRLEANNYTVVTAHDGEEALELAKKEKPDLVVLDLMLPKKDGYEVCLALRADKEFKDIPIIMLTACGKAPEIQKGMEKGADAYLAKPFSADMLLGIVNGMLGPGAGK